jgi:hypothetical protein
MGSKPTERTGIVLIRAWREGRVSRETPEMPGARRRSAPFLPCLEAYAKLAPLAGFIADMGGDRLPRPRLIARRRA